MKCDVMVGGDLAFETAGTKITTNQAVGKCANIVLVGYSKTRKLNLEISLDLDKEETFNMVFRYHLIYHGHKCGGRR